MSVHLKNPLATAHGGNSTNTRVEMGGWTGTEETPVSSCCSLSSAPTGPLHRVLPSKLLTLGSPHAVKLRAGDHTGRRERQISVFIYFRPTGLNGTSPSLQMHTENAVCVPQLLISFCMPASFLGTRCQACLNPLPRKPSQLCCQNARTLPRADLALACGTECSLLLLTC